RRCAGRAPSSKSTIRSAANICPSAIRSRCRIARPKSRGRRSSVSTPRKSWRNWATATSRSLRCAPPRRSDAHTKVETRKIMANNQAVRKILDTVKASGRTSLTAPEGKQVCDAYGIPVPKEGVATSADEAAKLAAGMGFPVVLKIVSPEILHKTEAGGVLVGVKNADEAKKGF